MGLRKRQGESLGMGAAPEREVTVVERPVQIKALSNPERARILTLLIERPGTAKQVADWIEGTRGRVHYHIKEIEHFRFTCSLSRCCMCRKQYGIYYWLSPSLWK